jgi:hypothetical protein
MANEHKFPGGHNFDDWSAITLHADSIADRAGIISAPGCVEDFKNRLCLECDVVRGEDGTKFVAKDSGKEMLEHVLTDFRKKAPHFWHTEAPPDLAELAFLNGNRTAAGQLVKAIGVEAAKAEAAKWGTDLYSGKPGKRPSDAPEPTKPQSSLSSNPWSRQNWNVTKQAQLVRSIGAERAAGIAKAMGCVLGSTKPNPNYN